MNPLRRQRLVLVVFVVVAASAAVGLVTYALRENINLFYTPSQVVAGEVPEGVRLRIGGMVVVGSLTRGPDSLARTFQVTDGAGTVRVNYTGILPDLFAENAAAVAAGKLRAGVLIADEVLAKHDEDYTPPEVVDAMQAAKATAQATRRAAAP